MQVKSLGRSRLQTQVLEQPPAGVGQRERRRGRGNVVEAARWRTKEIAAEQGVRQSTRSPEVGCALSEGV